MYLESIKVARQKLEAGYVGRIKAIHAPRNFSMQFSHIVIKLSSHV
jgi:hypothetical protein